MDRQTVAIEVKKALSETVLLSDGRRGYIISEIHEKGQDKWECHVCSRVIATERAMLMHLSHPLHMSKLRATHHPAENFRRKQSRDDRDQKKATESSKSKKEEKLWETDTVRPGEPIPPGMEDVVKKVIQIQETLDNHSGPLIGIEYIVELISTEEAAEPKYICLLCEKKGDPRSVMVHLTSHNHALRYISCFFRTAGNAINMIPKIRENRKGVAVAVQKIAEAIEKHFGRLKPTTAVAETFAQQKYDILRSIDEKEHFRETPTTTFVEYCTPEKIKEYSKLAEAEFNALKNKSMDKSDLNITNENAENGNKNSTDAPAKLSFSIGKPERSFGRNKSMDLNKSDEKKDDDEVIFVSASSDPIEIHSMSSISSASDDDVRITKVTRDRSRSRSRGRVRGRQSPLRRRGSPRRRSPLYRDDRYRSRSRSRSRGRYFREKDRYSRSSRDLDRIYGRDRRSRSKERLRYDSSRGRSERDRYRRSISQDRERRRSPRSMKHGSEHSPPPKIRHVKSPDPKKKKALNEFRAKMDAYRAKLHDLEVEMDNKLKYYRERPEKHPQYSEEWKSFWNRRYKELQQSGKDPTGYDFKPEWILFWDDRVKQLHEEELTAKKEELKSMLPEEEKGPSHDLQDISPPTPESAKDITVDDIKNTWKALTGSEIKAPSKVRSPISEANAKSPVSRRSPSPWEERSKHSRKPAPTYTADPPIVHCLRMLSVLEQQLGSLGPKALDLLSKAILMEKVKHNESMTLLQDPEVHIFFETVKEKIRGQLIAGIVVRHLVNSCRSLITAIESMVAANPLKPKPIIQPTVYTPIQPEPVKVAKLDISKKIAVSQEIAETLIAQGKTNLTEKELEELINAVTGTGVPSTPKVNVNPSVPSFISPLTVQQSAVNSNINDLLNNLISSTQNSMISHVTPNVPAVENVISQPVLPEVTNSLLQSAASLISTVPSLGTAATVPPAINTANMKVYTDIASPAKVPSEQASVKAYTDAVSAAKATISENTLLSPAIKEKPLYPVHEPSVEKEIDKPPSNKVSDDDLKERLMKFKTLSRDEQQSLIALLKELESKEPERVEKLRKYVTVGLTQSSATSKSESEAGRLSPFSSRAGGTNPAPEEKKKSTFMMDSDHEDDDDDYSVEDVYKSVSEKLKKKESERRTDFRINPAELMDENTSSSRQSFSNPGRPPSPYAAQAKNFNSDPRLQYSSSSQHPKNDYSVYSVSDSSSFSNKQAPADTYNAPPERYAAQPVDNTYKSWDGPDRGNQQWSGTKSWSQGTQEVYPPAGRLSGYQNSYDGGAYPQGMPPYKPGPGPYYGGDPGPYAPGGPNSNPQYSNTQSYQAGPPFDPNTGAPPNYSFQKPPGQAYYGNFRQY